MFELADHCSTLVLGVISICSIKPQTSRRRMGRAPTIVLAPSSQPHLMLSTSTSDFARVHRPLVKKETK